MLFVGDRKVLESNRKHKAALPAVCAVYASEFAVAGPLDGSPRFPLQTPDRPNLFPQSHGFWISHGQFPRCWCVLSDISQCEDPWFFGAVAATVYMACANGWYELAPGYDSRCKRCLQSYYCRLDSLVMGGSADC